jgi:hypothetical protein
MCSWRAPTQWIREGVSAVFEGVCCVSGHGRQSAVCRHTIDYFFSVPFLLTIFFIFFNFLFIS